MIRLIKNFEEIVGGFFLTVTVLVVILNVILRYFFHTGIFWVEEVATSAFVWSVFVGCSAAYKRGMHIGIDVVTSLLPDAFQPYIKLMVHVLMIIINGYIFYLSIIFTQASSIKTTPVLDISSAWVSSAIIVGFALMTFHSIRFLVEDAARLTKKQGAAQ